MPVGNVMLVRLVQLQNVPDPIRVSWLPGAKITVVKLVEESNIKSLKLVTLLGMVMLVKLVLLNARKPILVTLLGMVTLVNLELQNALSPILVTLLGMEKLPLTAGGIRIRVFPDLLYNTPFWLE
jgi:hypothetical protein